MPFYSTSVGSIFSPMVCIIVTTREKLGYSNLINGEEGAVSITFRTKNKRGEGDGDDDDDDDDVDVAPAA
ncbi:hypothetical protein RHGRI_033146 [Rhododendron griersonianum]|uniref:Uncharacterized protein n=1 Tax=Rhododendron griersonianum TaxID=479676 RepID=A0AAV6HW29_9ERIC|nr:hypothetical protein RHGRI_033146 [Rhododendron griersonianum]